MRIKLLTIIIFFCLFSVLFAQNTDRDLAREYYKNKEYDKAAEIYKRLYNSTQSSYYLSNYVKCQIELEEYADTEKFLKKESRRNKQNYDALVELGNLYKLQGEGEKAEKLFNDLVDDIGNRRSTIVKAGNALISKREFEYAEKVFLKGRKVEKGDYGFNYELANVYYYQRKYEDMMNEYLDLLEISEAYAKSVQNRLQNILNRNTEEGVEETIQQAILKRIQKSPDKYILSEMLIWLYLQEKNFDAAKIQALSLDKRKDEDGERLIAIGRMARENKQYQTAVDCYKYVISKGSESIYYVQAKNEYLTTLYDKIIDKGADKQELAELESELSQSIDELGKNDQTVPLILKSAHIKAFYLKKYEEGIKLLNEASNLPQLSLSQSSEIQLELADVLLLSGDPWEASLYYAKVEKNNKNNPIGHEAKFRRARLAYFTGQFKWAQALLDILKAATSKLIANDAFELSGRISDNTALDTSETALMMYARADLAAFRNQDSLSLLILDSLETKFAAHSLIDESLFLKYKIAKRNTQYNKAAEYLNKIITDRPYELLADNAMFYLGELYEFYLNDTEKAKELYKRIITEHPGSFYVNKARKRYRELRGDVIKDEVEIDENI